MGLVHNAARTRVAAVDASSELTIGLSVARALAGYVAAVGGNTLVRQSAGISPQKRLAVGIDAIFWSDHFSSGNGIIPNYRKYLTAAASYSAAVTPSVGLVFNSSGLLASNASFLLKTYRTFPTFSKSPIVVDAWFSPVLGLNTGADVLIGLGTFSGGVLLPAEGIYLQITAGGTSELVLQKNPGVTNVGPITTSAPFPFKWNVLQTYHLKLVITHDVVELYIDDELQTSAVRPLRFDRLGGFLTSSYQHLFAVLRTVNAAQAPRLILQRWSVTVADGRLTRPWASARTGLGDHLFSSPDGVNGVQLENIANSAAPTSAVLSNISGGYGNLLLGGNFQFAAIAGAETDYALFAYQVPSATLTQVAKNLIVTGIEIDTENTGAAVATTPTLLNWYVGTGSSTVSLATTDSATTRAPHRKFLGAQVFPVGTAIGGRDGFVKADFSACPIVVEAGTFLHIILRMPVATATASQFIRGAVTIRGYFE
jgi:hypothetical protein